MSTPEKWLVLPGKVDDVTTKWKKHGATRYPLPVHRFRGILRSLIKLLTLLLAVNSVIDVPSVETSYVSSFCTLLLSDLTAEAILQYSNHFNSWKYDFMASYLRRFPHSPNRWVTLHTPWCIQCLQNTGWLSILINELSQIIWSPTFAMEMATASEKCNSPRL